MKEIRLKKLTHHVTPFVFEINGDFSRKSRIFPTLVYLTSPLSGSPLELGNTGWPQETRTMGLPEWERSLTISLAVWTRTWRTDRQIYIGWQQVPRLRITSRGKKIIKIIPCLSKLYWLPSLAHCYWDTVFAHHAKCGCCLPHRLRVCRKFQKFELWIFNPLGWGAHLTF